MCLVDEIKFKKIDSPDAPEAAFDEILMLIYPSKWFLRSGLENAEPFSFWLGGLHFL